METNDKALQNVLTALRSVSFTGVFLACLVSVSLAPAATIADAAAPLLSISDDVAGILPPSGLSGWFFDVNPNQPFPSQPDPAKAWTSADNIATMNYWQSLVLGVGSDPGIPPGLDGLGMIDPATPATLELSQMSLQQDMTEVPEPKKEGLFGVAAVLLAFYAALRRQSIAGTRAAIMRQTCLVMKA